MILSEQIKLGRKQLGMSQADLADAIWVSRNTVSNWERGDTTPDIQSLVLMGALFGLSLDEMVKGDEQVMAQALERDKNHLLIAGETFNPGNRQAADWNHTSTLGLFELRSTGGPAHGKFEDADVTDHTGLRIAWCASRRYSAEAFTTSWMNMGTKLALSHADTLSSTPSSKYAWRDSTESNSVARPASTTATKTSYGSTAAASAWKATSWGTSSR
nr:helix-turn-helix transcriptional regulator [uncultured Collinsella sp.]